jgi:hypothetical protein
MKAKDFEARVLAIWLRSRVPLTLPHVQHLTGESRARSKQYLDEMTVAGQLEMDVADDGEMIWTVRGAERPASGAQTVAELEKLEALTAEVASASGKSMIARAAVSSALAARGGDQKSLVGSGVLSLVLGPLGWLYAAPLREAVPGVAIYLGVCALLPHVLLTPLLGILAPLSGAAGIYYAWRHNQTGERTSLFGGGKKKPAAD